MIPDRCGTVPPHPPGDGSGEIAAGRVLHVQRSTLPLELNSTAQPRLGRRPPLPAVLANSHHPPPALDNMAQRPQIPGRPSHVHRLVQVLLEPGRSVSGKRHGPAQPARTNSGPVAGSAPQRHGSSRPDQSSAQEWDSVCSGEPACRSSPPLGMAIIERLLLPKQLGPSPTVIPPEYRQHHPTLDDWHNLTRLGRCCTQGALLSSDDYGSSG
jgi:hypothetical protein